MAQRTTMTAEEIVDELQRIANTDIADFADWDGKKGQELRQCIESITQHETQHVKYLKIKLHCKVAALAMLAKYHNLFKRTVASKGLVVVIQRPANALGSPQERIVVNTKPSNGQAVLPEITFSQPPGVKMASTTGAGSTNG
jgi:hypothetical protein